ncbi:hypothetical protein HPB48_002163 [Haemaphysalis longicornis]|uniref:Uncharacterized protein n=1 Tax=Haemaphysalis longicornis TaxID=44386 RepID=A0A9J6FIM2_HAELO|nr:hypothetical protein HPB48_002163 [Haemaphysalis longicornis]
MALCVAAALLAAAALRAQAVCIVPDLQFREIRNASEQVQDLIKLFRTGAEKGMPELLHLPAREDSPQWEGRPMLSFFWALGRHPKGTIHRKLKKKLFNIFSTVHCDFDLTKEEPEGSTYRELSQFADRFGSRMLGSAQLEKSIDHLVELFKLDHFQDVHTEDVLAVRWRRQQEVARLVRPEEHQLHILGLGGSSGTPPGGITAPLDVVKSFAELEMKGPSVSGHIVLYVPEWKGHGNYASYLLQGTTKAARLGALGVLFRAPEPLTGTALFAGLTGYEKDAPRIGAAVLTKQDSDMLVRMVDRRQEVLIHLSMDPGEPQQVVSRNIVVQWTGTKFPKEAAKVPTMGSSKPSRERQWRPSPRVCSYS